MGNKYSLSKNDSIVMDVVWENGEVNVSDILDILKGQKGFTKDTVKTYIRRLREKGLVGVKKLSPRKYFYYPLIKKDVYLAQRTREYLDNNYADIKHMFAGLVENKQISHDEISELEEYIQLLKK